MTISPSEKNNQENIDLLQIEYFSDEPKIRKDFEPILFSRNQISHNKINDIPNCF